MLSNTDLNACYSYDLLFSKGGLQPFAAGRTNDRKLGRFLTKELLAIAPVCYFGGYQGEKFMRYFFLALTISLCTGAAAQESPNPILFTNVHVFDGLNEERIENANVLVVGNLIAEISTEPLSAANAQVIDGGGRTLMPGLIDQHVHYSIFLPLSDTRANLHPYAHGALAVLRAKEFLMNGYTTTRDMGGPSNYLRLIIDEGLTPGPRIYPTENFISASSGHADFRDLNDPTDVSAGTPHFYSEYVHTIADGPDETTKAVRNAFRRGATQIKLFTSGGVSSTYDPLHSGPNADEIRAAVAVAEAWDTYVATHSFNEDAIRLAIDNGVRSIEHAPFLTDEIAQAMIEKGVFLATAVAPVFDITVETAQAQYSPASFAKWLSVREAASEALMVISRNPELKVVLGSDLLGPWNNLVETDDKMNLEFNYFADAIGNFRTLRMATSVAGEMNMMTGKMNPYTDGALGVIQVGAYADILLVSGNPLEDISLMTTPDESFAIIMKDGVIYKNTLE